MRFSRVDFIESAEIEILRRRVAELEELLQIGDKVMAAVENNVSNEILYTIITDVYPMIDWSENTLLNRITYK